MLHMRATRHDGASGLFGLLNQRGRKTKQHLRDDSAMAAKPHADKRGNLVVAGTACAQLASEFVSRNLQQATFKRGSLVLIVLDRGEGTGINTALQLVKGILHTLQFIGGEQTGAAERAGVGA